MNNGSVRKVQGYRIGSTGPILPTAARAVEEALFEYLNDKCPANAVNEAALMRHLAQAMVADATTLSRWLAAVNAPEEG